jgi:hypothetical protein
MNTTTIAAGPYVKVSGIEAHSNRTVPEPPVLAQRTIVTCEQPYRRNAEVAQELLHLLPVVEQLLRIPLCYDSPRPTLCVDETVMRSVFAFLTRYGTEMSCPYSRRSEGCGVSLEWDVGTTEVSVEFFADGDVVVMVDDDGDVKVDDSLSSALWSEALALIGSTPDLALDA